MLLVEDEPALREVTRRLLARNGYQVISAASGQEAVNAATTCRAPITLLLTDVIMPGMQGREVTEQGVLASGINLIEKPFTEAALLTKLRETLLARGPA